MVLSFSLLMPEKVNAHEWPKSLVDSKKIYVSFCQHHINS